MSNTIGIDDMNVMLNIVGHGTGERELAEGRR